MKIVNTLSNIRSFTENKKDINLVTMWQLIISVNTELFRYQKAKKIYIIDIY